MKISILNGNPDIVNQSFEGYIARLSRTLTAGGHQVTVLDLRDMDIRYCIGCFGCWVKKPGECLVADDAPEVCRAVINSDFMLWAAPLKMGYPGALLKKMMDKTIPLIHPYFAVVNNEAHHRARYEHYPLVGLLLEKELDTDESDIRIVTQMFCRTALNYKSRLVFALTTDQPVEQVAESINHPSKTRVTYTVCPGVTSGVRVSPPGRITVFNGSPRGRRGNTPILLDQFVKGFTSTGARTSETFHLNRLKEAVCFPQAFAEAECVLVGFPLYTDAMPGIVKAFIDTLEPLRAKTGNPPVGFLVQSGFPESAHSRYVERYLEKLASRLGSPYLGTIVKGGCEGVRLMPENMNQKLFSGLFQIGLTFAQTGQFDGDLLHKLAKPERYPAYLGPFFRLLMLIPGLNIYWNNQLKENGVYEKRFARPFVD
jgi:multimeric flavodoxin WrbA